MKLRDLYTDIYSKLTLGGIEHDVNYLDIVKSINDSIREIRQELIIAEVPNEFVTSEDIELNEDEFFDGLNSGDLEKEILEDVPINFSIINSILFKTNNELIDEDQSFNKGDIAYKGKVLYKAIDEISNVNTYTLTFNPSDVRTYREDDGLLYKKGDIVFDIDTKEYFGVNEEFIATDASPDLTKLYWMKIEDGWLRGSYVEYFNLDKSIITDDDEFYPFISVRGKTIYSNKFIERIKISYIPKWNDVKNLDDELNLPEIMIPKVKDLSLSKLLYYFKGIANEAE